jgi:hypothetical protein
MKRATGEQQTRHAQIVNTGGFMLSEAISRAQYRRGLTLSLAPPGLGF